MHQPVDLGMSNKLIPDNFDFGKLGEVMKDAKPLTSAPLCGMGKRAYIQLTQASIKLGIEFYVEYVVHPAPADPEIGFNPEDVTRNEGVAIYTIAKEGDDKNEKQLFGEVVSVESFLEYHHIDDVTQLIIERCMEKLDKHARLSDDFLGHLNDLWKDRKVDTKYIYKAHIC